MTEDRRKCAWLRLSDFIVWHNLVNPWGMSGFVCFCVVPQSKPYCPFLFFFFFFLSAVAVVFVCLLGDGIVDGPSIPPPPPSPGTSTMLFSYIEDSTGLLTPLKRSDITFSSRPNAKPLITYCPPPLPAPVRFFSSFAVRLWSSSGLDEFPVLVLKTVRNESVVEQRRGTWPWGYLLLVDILCYLRRSGHSLTTPFATYHSEGVITISHPPAILRFQIAKEILFAVKKISRLLYIKTI